MLRTVSVWFCGLLVTLMATESSGQLILKDASNEDRLVGAAAHGPNVGIPQGHSLKVVVQEVRHGRQMAAGAPVTIHISHGNQPPVAQITGVLDDTGYGEFLVLVDASWPQEVYQTRIDIERQQGKRVTLEHLQSVFRVIEGEPEPEIPEGWPGLLLLLAAAGFVLWLRRPALICA